VAEQRNRGIGPQPITELLAKTADRIDTLYHSADTLTGLPTGFIDFDDMTSGLQEGDLIIIAGRPSMGKTTFAMNIAENAAMHSVKEGGKPVLIFSMEMPAESLVMRMLSSLGRVDQHRVRTGKLNDSEWPRITSAISMLSEAKMYIDDTPSLTPTELRSRARRVAREHDGLSLIVIDYLQLMQVHGLKENRTAEISEISRALKALAKELHVPVIALSQLNRSLEQRQNRRPVMSDLRESGAIEQDADLIAFIYRDEVYNEDSPDKGMAEIIIGKQRNGPIGKVNLTFLGQFTRFENYTSAIPRTPFGGGE
jgi:replicative DNA helicase